MKKLLLSFVAVLTIAGCATPEERAARQAEHMAQVKNAVGSQQYKINVREMTPLRSSSINVTGMYYLKVNGNEVTCDLPYLGRDDIPHFKTRAERHFDRTITISAPMEGYNLSLMPKQKAGLITFSSMDGGKKINFNIQVFSDGSAKMTVDPEDKDEIRYDGEVYPIK